MLLVNACKLIFTFWKAGLPMAVLLPAVLVAAAGGQLLLAGRLRKRWLGPVLFAGIAVLCQATVWIAAAAVGRDAVGVALLCGMVAAFSLDIALGCLLGLLLRRAAVRR